MIFFLFLGCQTSSVASDSTLQETGLEEYLLCEKELQTSLSIDLGVGPAMGAPLQKDITISNQCSHGSKNMF